VPDHITWAALIEDFEGRVRTLQEQLAPIEAGKLRLGHAGADTGGKWIDITETHAQHLKNDIASLQNTIARIRRDHA
jgi:hypothetical protein